jgi:hypothetical protein
MAENQAFFASQSRTDGYAGPVTLTYPENASDLARRQLFASEANDCSDLQIARF